MLTNLAYMKTKRFTSRYVLSLTPFAFLCLYLTFTVGEPAVAFVLKPIYSMGDSQVPTMPVDSLHAAYRGVVIQNVRTFYARREQKLFWTYSNRPWDRADSVIAFIQQIRYYGLLPDDYHIREIRQLRDKLTHMDSIYRFEALLTDAYISMVCHIQFGKGMYQSHQTDSSVIAMLEHYWHGSELFESIARRESSLRGYQSLKIGLKQLLDSLSPKLRNLVLSNEEQVPDSINNRLQTIEINLERWRSERKSFGSRYIFINIPAFMLYLVDHDSVILESKVIVGTPQKQTPTLSSLIQCFVTYPYWHVPRKIAIEEYLPVIQRDVTFIERNNFDVLDRSGKLLNPDSVDWKEFDKAYFPVSLRQREGEENALGVIKFVFDSPYGVFLHDTNAKRLFRSHVRAFSHGCIRMEKAVELAHYLATGDLKHKSKYIDRFLKEASRHTIELQSPIPIHIRYYTCAFNSGVLNFYEDIYRKDKRVSKIIYSKSLTGGYTY